eukprot:XP_014790449.1 PREDICTED: uncharacterized protein LOC106883823 [Octopus bimaculoides]
MIPAKWNNFNIITIYKRKSDNSEYGNSPGISVVDVAGKILARFMLKRLLTHLIEGILQENQCGFRLDRWTLGMIFAKRLESWYKGDLIRDRDIIKSIDINLEDFKNIVAATGAAVNSFETFFYANIRINRDVVDVGILRYPGLGDSSFKLYRIKLSAFRYTKRILFVEETSSGIHGTFNMHEFIPNDGAMEKMDPTLRDRFLKSALDFLLEF